MADWEAAGPPPLTTTALLRQLSEEGKVCWMYVSDYVHMHVRRVCARVRVFLCAGDCVRRCPALWCFSSGAC